MLIRLIIYLAYFLKTAAVYRQCKDFFYNLLENPQSRAKYYFDLFMIVLVLLSVFLLIHEVKSEQLSSFSVRFEYMVVSLFIIEYLLRFWLHGNIHDIIIEHYEKSKYLNIPVHLTPLVLAVVRKKMEYVFSPMAIIDLLAIFPSYRSLRILRIFLIFRLFKLFRYSKSIKIFIEVLASKRFELYTLILFIGFIVFIASTAFYLFENEVSGGDTQNVFDAIYWAIVTISTVGYGDITPQTTGGRIVSLALILTGLGILSFFTSIIVAAFGEKMPRLRENRIYAELEKHRTYVIISGFGRVGKEIVRQLEKDRQRYVIIEKNLDKVIQARNQGALVIHGDASDNRILEAAGIRRNASTIICTTGNDVHNVYITLSSRQLNPEISIIARVNHKENEKKLLQAGADYVIHPLQTAAMIVAEYVGQPVASEALHGILMENKNILMDTIKVDPGSFLESVKIGELDFASMKLTLVGVISDHAAHKHHKNKYKVHQQFFYFNPPAHFVLHQGDRLLLLGRDFSMDYFKTQLEKSRLQLG